MYWTLELASYLEDAPWPATKDELIDFAMRTGAPLEVVENLQQIEDDEEVFDTIEDIWPDYPTKEDFFFNEDEYCSADIMKVPASSGIFYLRGIQGFSSAPNSCDSMRERTKR